MRVTASECADIRRRYREIENIAEVADIVGRSKQTVSTHLKGQCAHDIDEEPIQPSVIKIDEEDCAEIRERVRDGAGYRDLVDEYEVNYKTIGNHAVGRCSHDIDTQPKEKQPEMTAEECAEIRRRSREESYTEIAKDSRFSEQSLYVHGRGDCQHGIDIEPMRKYFDYSDVDRQQIIDWYYEDHLHVGQIQEKLSNEHGEPEISWIKDVIFS